MAALTAAANAAEPIMGLQYHTQLRESLPDYPAERVNFWERLEFAYEDRADEIFGNYFHPLAELNWEVASAGGGFGEFRERADRAAQKGFTKSITYSAREAAVELPVMNWLRERQWLLADFLFDTVDSVEEESLSPLNLSYRPVERSWWARLSENRQFRFGIRPFRTDPYAYMGMALKDGDKTVLLGHVRYHLEDFSNHRFELAVSVPIAPGFSFDMGTSYQFGQSPDEKQIVFKLFREFKSGIMHVGFELAHKPAMIAGMSFVW